MPAFPQRMILVPMVVALAIAWRMPLVAQSAERPDASRLLPDDTVLYLRLPDTGETITKFKETAIGRISQDPAMQPLISQLYGTAIDAFQQIENEIGASLDELLSIPQGELCLALVAPAQNRPVPVFLVDVGSRLPIVERLLERIGQRLEAGNFPRREETVGQTRVTVYDRRGEGTRQVVFVVRDGVVLVTSSLDVAKAMLMAWEGQAEPGRTLADDPSFTTIMRRCLGTDNQPPQVEFFVNPVTLFSRLTRGDVSAQVAVAMFPALGVNGIRGLGGSLTFATEEFDSLTHLHLLLDNPRTGVLELLALQAGDTTPETWVPADAASYVTVHWDLAKSYAKFATLYDSIRGENALADSFERDMLDRLQIDVRKDLIDAAAGRLTLVNAFVRPARVNSRANLLGIKLKDAKAFDKTLQKLLDQAGPALIRETLGGVTVYRAPTRNPPAEAPRRGPRLRQPDPAVAILDDYLLLSDSSDVLKQALAAKLDPAQSLADQLEFRLVASKIRRLPGGERPGLIAFDRPEEALRLWYDIATADTTRQRLTQRAENNQLLRGVNTALQDHPLPPFSVLARYLAPSGSLLTDDESGLHYVGFTLRRK
jgi:hypothetical protein